MKTIALLAVLSLAAAPVQEMPKPPSPTPQHTWLSQLVGEWNVTTEIVSPDSAPMKFESTESVRSIGGLWVLAEGTIPVDATSSMTTLLTIGYDTREKAFVGTWVDTMHPQLWVYRGTLDDAKKTLTLEATGPKHDDPTKTAKYRDLITIVGPDRKRFTSSIQGDDGQWTQYMSTDYRRKK